MEPHRIGTEHRSEIRTLEFEESAAALAESGRVLTMAGGGPSWAVEEQQSRSSEAVGSPFDKTGTELAVPHIPGEHLTLSHNDRTDT